MSVLIWIIHFQVLLGVGSFGTVFRIPWNDGSAALKVYRNEHATEDVWREISLLAKCDHPNIVKILGAGPSFPRKIFFLVMEYAECFSVNDGNCYCPQHFVHVVSTTNVNTIGKMFGSSYIFECHCNHGEGRKQREKKKTMCRVHNIWQLCYSPFPLPRPSFGIHAFPVGFIPPSSPNRIRDLTQESLHQAFD